MGFFSKLFSGNHDSHKANGWPAFAEGQVWVYDTRPHESGSRLYIAKVKHIPKYGKIFHICVDGLRVANPHAKDGILEKMGFSRFRSRK